MVVDLGPPGERYFRHPGDVVRLVLFGVALVVMLALTSWATATTQGTAEDLGRAAARPALGLRRAGLLAAQLAVAAVPLAVVAGLALRGRWRRLGTSALAALAGGLVTALVDRLADLPGRPEGAVTGDTWLAASTFPSVAVLGGVVAASAVGKPWLARSRRRLVDAGQVVLVVLMAAAGSASGPQLLVGVLTGATVGAAVLVALGAPNRRPDTRAIEDALRLAGFDVARLTLRRAAAGRDQLFDVSTRSGGRAFVKVHGRDSRDGDLLYRAYRGLLLRGGADGWPPTTPEGAAEHEALMLLLARRAGAASPGVEALSTLDDGSTALVLEHVDGSPLGAAGAAVPADAAEPVGTAGPSEVHADLLDALWHQVDLLHRARLAHRSLRAANVLVADGQPTVVDLGFAKASATPRLLAIDRAELLASTAALVGAAPAVASAARVLEPADLAAAVPFLQRPALSAATRRQARSSLLGQVRAAIVEATGQEAAPLERLVRVRPRTAITVAALAAAFYVLLPQLAQVGDSLAAIRSANWGWLAACGVLSVTTYAASAVGLTGGVPERLPFLPTLASQLASSFVNRITPAKVGGLALNVRYLQKAGIDPAGAVTGIGLTLLAGGIVHTLLTIGFVAWAGRSDASGFALPSGSTALVVIALGLAVLGAGLATGRGRRLIGTHVGGFVRRSAASLATLARMPGKLAALFGGALGVTLSYLGALVAALAAFGGDASVAQVGAVYLGSSIIASAAPTPGGLGAMEAALVAGLTGVGVDAGEAVAAVLAYRLATYWLPILPGWIAFHLLERRGVI